MLKISSSYGLDKCSDVLHCRASQACTLWSARAFVTGTSVRDRHNSHVNRNLEFGHF